MITTNSEAPLVGATLFKFVHCTSGSLCVSEGRFSSQPRHASGSPHHIPLNSCPIRTTEISWARGPSIVAFLTAVCDKKTMTII